MKVEYINSQEIWGYKTVFFFLFCLFVLLLLFKITLVHFHPYLQLAVIPWREEQ